VDYVNHLTINGSTLDVIASSPRALPQANLVDAADPAAGGGFEDHFNSDTSTLSTTLWTAGGTAAIVSNRLRMTSHSTYADMVTSVAKYSMVGRRAQVRIPTVPTAATGEALLRLTTDANNWLSIGKSGSNLLMRNRVGGSNSDTSIAYSSTNHAYVRIRESVAGTIVWETSPDGAAWTVQRTVSSGLAPYTNINAVLIAGHTSAGSTDDQTVEFDDFVLI